MKKITYLLITLVIALGCSQSDKDEDPAEEVAVFGLSLDSAESYAQRYNDVVSETLHMPAPIRGFTIRSQDLLQVLGLPIKKTKYSYARIYLGLDHYLNFRAFLMPVDSGTNGYPPGTDVVLKGKYLDGWLRESGPNKVVEGEYVFDFTQPCPSSCDEKSPIFAHGIDTTAISYITDGDR